MKELEIKDIIVSGKDYQNNNELEKVDLFHTMVIASSGVFRNCTSLTDVYFGLDITRIGNGTFENCKSLTDVWFAIIDEDKIIEIAEDAFDGCDRQITFHIFASAVKNKYLNNYAKRHGFRVEGML